MKVYTYAPFECFGSNTYLVDFSGKGIIIDPSVSYESVKELIENEKISISYIFITHAHFDHFLTLDEWASKTGARVIVGTRDARALSDSYYNCYKLFLSRDAGYFGKYETVKDGDIISFFGNEISIIETPGHSKGSISIKIDDNIFVGDVVFAGNSHGRCDLPGGDIGALMNSIKILMEYPENTVIYPGHGRPARIKDIKSFYI